MTGEDATQAVAALLALLDLEELDTDLYRGPRHPGGRGRVFGGQVIAQALVAATRSAPADRLAHSLHAYFMRPGDEDRAILYHVRRDFDGGSFSTRHVTALQEGKPILHLSASFQRPEQGLSHAAPVPDVPRPDALAEQGLAGQLDLPPAIAWMRRRFGALELRPVDPGNLTATDPRPPVDHVWFRLARPAPNDPAVQTAILAYVSDLGLISTAILPHGGQLYGAGMQMASLDHALWLHQPPQLERWLLYTRESPWSGGGRGLGCGAFYTEDGQRVATVIQEGLLRRRRPTTTHEG